MIYDAHQPLGQGFEPPRAGTMPRRGHAIAIGLDDATAKRADRSRESIGHNPTSAWGAHADRRGDARRRGTIASTESKRSRGEK